MEIAVVGTSAEIISAVSVARYRKNGDFFFGDLGR